MGTENEGESVFEAFHVLVCFVLVSVTDGVERNKKMLIRF